MVDGGMPETRDYWMQVLASDGTPQSDPLQFHFTQGSTLSIVANLQAGNVTTVPESNGPLIGVQWDGRLTGMHISIAPVTGLAAGQPYLKIISARYQDEFQSGGNHHLFYTVLDENGRPAAGVPIILDWQGRDPGDNPNIVYTDGNGTANYGLYAGPVGWNPELMPGPYSGWVGDPDLRSRNSTGIPGEKFVGAGLPMNRHGNFIVTWRKSSAGEMPASSSISGMISGVMPGAVVKLMGPQTRSMVVDKTGTYSFAGLPAGVYSLSIDGGPIMQSDIAVDGISSVHFDFAFRPANRNSQLRGTIYNGAPNLQLALTSGTQPLSTTVDPSGNYVFANLGPGSYALAIAGVGLVNPKILLDGTNAVTFDYTLPLPPGKLLSHYLLFGSPAQGGAAGSAARTNLILALDYIARFAPTIGFSLKEARSALNVTIVGTNATSAAEEQALKSAGCIVRRIAGTDSYAMEQLFAQLVLSGNPYPST
jgi:hypothetical protein